MPKDDLSKERDDSFREAGEMKLTRPGDLTSRTKGLTRPVVEVAPKPLPRNVEDDLYLTHPPRAEVTATPEKPRDEKGRFVAPKD